MGDFNWDCPDKNCKGKLNFISDLEVYDILGSVCISSESCCLAHFLKCDTCNSLYRLSSKAIFTYQLTKK